jgi:ADP-ribose pyrophosphatase YjhB (NUDIX family)
VAYYLAAPTRRGVERPDETEVSEIRWFGWNELPASLAPPGTLDAVLKVARRALAEDLPPLPDRPA